MRIIVITNLNLKEILSKLKRETNMFLHVAKKTKFVKNASAFMPNNLKVLNRIKTLFRL